MSEESLKLKIQTIHKNLLGTNLDQKTLRFWVHTVLNNNEKITEFYNTILGSNDYRKNVYKQYREAYFDLVGFDMNDSVFDAFFESQKGKIVTPQMIRSHIFTLEACVSKYSEIIKSIYTLEKCTECDMGTLTAYLRKFEHSDTYDIDLLRNDIASNIHAEVKDRKDTHCDPRFQRLLDAFGDDRIDEIIDQVIRDETVNRDTVTREVLCEMREDQIKAFESVFGRPMFVQEYFKYVTPNYSFDSKTLITLKQHTSIMYNKVRELYDAYAILSIDEYFFISKYLYECECIDFWDNIVDAIIESPEYEKNMKHTLCKLYENMYDERLEEHDVQYIFSKVKADKVKVNSDDLKSILVDLKKETDNIISNIFEQFMLVLERQPDVYEIDENLQTYRVGLDNGLVKLNTDLERKLMSSLEFHDIIKKKIRLEYFSKHNKDILPSHMFNLLKTILDKLSPLMSFNEFNQLVTSVCT